LCLSSHRAAKSSSWILALLLLTLLTSTFASNQAYATVSPGAVLAANPPSTTTLYFRSATNAAGGDKVLNQIPGATNCNIAGSMCINEAFTCLNPFAVPCPNGVPKDFVSQPLAAPLKITMVAFSVYIKNNNPLITLKFKTMFNLTRNGATIYSQTSDFLSLKTGESAQFGILSPGNPVPDGNQAFAKGDKIDCSINVISVQDSAGKPRAATDLSLLYNGKVDSGAESRCTITTDVCPTFMAQSDGTVDGQAVLSCPISFGAVPEFGVSPVLVAAVALVMVLAVRKRLRGLPS
jgi:hypothetical protein